MANRTIHKAVDENMHPQPLINANFGILPFPALGDNTIYLRIAQSLTNAGAKVTIYSNILFPAKSCFPWLTIAPTEKERITEIGDGHDFLIVDVLHPDFKPYSNVETINHVFKNIIAVTATKFPADLLKLTPQNSTILFSNPHRPICADPKQGKSMVEWADHYTKSVFNISAAEKPPSIELTQEKTNQKTVIIFPTTPNPKKNYHLAGFANLARKIRKIGYRVEFVVLPHEQKQVQLGLDGEDVLCFKSLLELMEHMNHASAVISNDSGGGHLASMMGIPTFTITKKPENFTWRPGFPGKSHIITPLFTVKIPKTRIWRPFIQQKKILKGLLDLL